MRDPLLSALKEGLPCSSRSTSVEASGRREDETMEKLEGGIPPYSQAGRFAACYVLCGVDFYIVLRCKFMGWHSCNCPFSCTWGLW